MSDKYSITVNTQLKKHVNKPSSYEIGREPRPANATNNCEGVHLKYNLQRQEEIQTVNEKSWSLG